MPNIFCRIFGHALEDVTGTDAPVEHCARCDFLQKPSDSSNEGLPPIKHPGSEGDSDPLPENFDQESGESEVQLTCDSCECSNLTGVGWVEGDSCPACRRGYLYSKDKPPNLDSKKPSA